MKQIQRDHKVYGIHRKTDRQISRFEIRNKRSNDKRRLCKCIGWMDQYYWRKDDVILWYGEKCIKHVWMSDTRRTLLQKRRTKKNDIRVPSFRGFLSSRFYKSYKYVEGWFSISK